MGSTGSFLVLSTRSPECCTFAVAKDSYHLQLHGRKRWGIYAPGKMTRTGVLHSEDYATWLRFRRTGRCPKVKRALQNPEAPSKLPHFRSPFWGGVGRCESAEWGGVGLWGGWDSKCGVGCLGGRGQESSVPFGPSWTCEFARLSFRFALRIVTFLSSSCICRCLSVHGSFSQWCSLVLIWADGGCATAMAVMP